jgi:hypothetical protein
MSAYASSSAHRQGRPHDTRDVEAVLAATLPWIAAAVRGRTASFVRFDADTARLDRRWAAGPDGVGEAAAVSIEPARIHPLLTEDARGRRPVRPAEDAAAWAVQDLLPGVLPEKVRLRVRAISLDGVWYGVLLVADPRLSLSRGVDARLAEMADYLELAMARAESANAAPPAPTETAVVEAPAEEVQSGAAEAAEEPEPWEATGEGEGPEMWLPELVDELEPASRDRDREQALDEAAARATELLMQAHVELDRQAGRLRAQTRVLHLLRGFLGSYAEGVSPQELASRVVQLISRAFGGSRCSLLLVDPASSAAGGMRLAAALGLPAQASDGRLRAPGAGGIASEVARTGREMVVRDESEARGFPLVRDGGYTGDAFASFPLVFQGRTYGVLNLTNFRSGRLDDAEVEQLRTVVLCLSMVVDHARLGERLFAS